MTNFHCINTTRGGCLRLSGIGEILVLQTLIIKIKQMKKLLLLLSCCLATWCSVQAGAKYSASSSEVSGMLQEASASNVMLSSPAAATSSGPAQITSFSYKEKESKICITYKTNNATSASVNLLFGGRVVNSSPISIPVSNYGTRTAEIPLGSDWQEGMYVVLLYVNGSVKGQISSGSVGPCYSVNVNVKAYGDIKTVTADPDAKKLTVKYSLQHGSTTNSSMRIYKGTTLLHSQTISNPNTSVNTYKDYSFSYSSFADKLIPDSTYTCKLYTNGRLVCESDFKMPSTYTTKIKSLTYEGGRLKINFTVGDLGAKLGFRVVAVPLSGSGNSETKYYDNVNRGYHEDSFYADVPSFNGQAVYAVVLVVNDRNVESKQIMIRR